MRSCAQGGSAGAFPQALFGRARGHAHSHRCGHGLPRVGEISHAYGPVSYTHLRAHETSAHL
eukprot:4976987-Alexandrium_andersonii.AAC.1